MKKRIFIVAGDKSGDLYGGLLAEKLNQKANLEIYSCGGENLKNHSKQIINLLHHSVTGLVEVLRSLPKIIKTLQQTIAAINEFKPDLVILIDFPDFNLRLAKTLNRRYKLFYYVSPQVWAWRPKRIEQLRHYVDQMIVLFKFEEDFFRQQKIPVKYFGHPLLELIKPIATPTKNIISFMPGSRKNVISHHLPLLIKAKDFLKAKLPNWEFRIIRPENIAADFYQKFNPNMPVIIHTQTALAESKFIIVSSGTATLELAILGVPYLLIYKMNALSWWLVKRLVTTGFAGIVNILAKRKIVKELLQNQAKPIHIAREALSLINDPQAYQALKTELNQIKELLTPNNASEKFARYILEYLSFQ